MRNTRLHFILSALTSLFAMAAPLRAANVLYFRDVPIGPDRVAEALGALGHNVALAIDANDFETQIASGVYDLGIIFVQTRPAAEYASAIHALSAFVHGGGRALYADWSRNDELASGFGAGFTRSEGGRIVTVLDRDLAGALVPNPLKLRNTGWFHATNGLIVRDTNPMSHGIVAATFETGAAAIVRDWSGRSLVFGFLGDTPESAAIFARGAEAVLAPVAGPIITQVSAIPSVRSSQLRFTVIPTNALTSVVIQYGRFPPIYTHLGKSIPGGSSPVPFEETINGLAPHTTYQYRIGATNMAGSNSSGDLTFTTLNTPPVANDDHLINYPTSGIFPLGNDSDADGDSLTIIAATDGEFGSVTFSDFGITYTRASISLRTDHFTYTVSDGFGGTATATVFIERQVNLPSFRGDYTQLLVAPELVDFVLGRLTLTLNAGGAFTGQLFLDNRRDPVAGAFGADGVAHVVVERPGSQNAELTLYLQFDGGAPQMVGEITYKFTTFLVNARTVLYDSENPPPAGKGRHYTFAGLKSRELEFLPGGDAWAVSTGGSDGRLRFTGCFPDGEAFSGDAQVQPDGTLPLYLLRNDPSLESLGGLLRFTGTRKRNLGGELFWTVFSTKDRLGFSTRLSVHGGRYFPPAAEEPILRFPEGSRAQAVAKLFSGFRGFRSWKQTLRVEKNGISSIGLVNNPISLQFFRSNGRFTGTFDHPELGRCQIRGVLLQRENRVRGNFFGADGLSGGFRLVPR